MGDDLDGLQALKGAQALDAAKNAVARAVERVGGEQMERGDGGVARADIDPARVERVGEPARARYVARPHGRSQPVRRVVGEGDSLGRSEEHTSELQSLMRTSYAV